MPVPHMVADLPQWEIVELPRPALGEGADVAYTSYEARRKDGKDPSSATIVDGCAAAPVPGWVEDMRQPVEHRGINLLVVSTHIAIGEPVGTRSEGDFYSLWADGKRVGSARLGLGFDDDPRVYTCWLVCAQKDGNTEACDDVVRTARFDLGSPAPPPGVALSAITWAVHHPRESAPVAGVVVAVLGTLAVVLRKKPRARI